MEYDLGVIQLSDLHAVEETIRYLEQNPNPTYDELINYLNWYWERDKDTLCFMEGRRPKSWMLDWIKALAV